MAGMARAIVTVLKGAQNCLEKLKFLFTISWSSILRPKQP